MATQRLGWGPKHGLPNVIDEGWMALSSLYTGGQRGKIILGSTRHIDHKPKATRLWSLQDLSPCQ